VGRKHLREKKAKGKKYSSNEENKNNSSKLLFESSNETHPTVVSPWEKK